MEFWEDLFSYKILDRGREYFEDDCVVNVKNKNNREYTATVIGSDYYNVSIKIRENNKLSLECDCPYAEKGYNCKHMAALLYEVNEDICPANDSGMEGIGSDPYGGDLEDDALNDIDEEYNLFENKYGHLNSSQLLHFIYGLIDEDEKIETKFNNHFSPVKPHNSKDTSLSHYERLIDKIEYKYPKEPDYEDSWDYEYYDGFENPWYSYDEDIEEFINENINSLIEKKEYELCFNALEYLLGVMNGNHQEARKYVALDYLYSKIISLVEEIYNKTNSKELAEGIEDWAFDSIILESAYFYYLNPLLCCFKLDENRLHCLYDEIDKKITKCLDGAHEENLIMAVKLKNDLLSKYEKSISKQYLFLKKYAKCIEVKVMLLELIKNKSCYLDETIGLLNEITESGNPAYFEKYILELKGIYQEIGNKDKYHETLVKIIKSQPNDIIQYYDELKKSCSADQMDRFNGELFDCLSCPELNKIYCHEKLYDNLFENIKNEPLYRLYEIKKYTDILSKKYSNQTIGLISATVFNLFGRTTQRAKYKENIEESKILLEYDGGAEEIMKLIEKLKKTYPRRRAMVEELDKFKMKIEYKYMEGRQFNHKT